MKKYTNQSGLVFEVIERLSKDRVLVRFENTGSIVETWGRNCAAGKVADPFHRSRLGIGYMGKFTKTSFHKQAYQLWSNMLKRCYDPNDKRGYFGKGVSVDPRWHCFADFLVDIQRLSGFQNWVNNEKFNLDKDLLGDGKTYSPYTCHFIPESVNKGLSKANKKLINGEWVTSIL